jgi:hypothetical protein
MLCDEALVDMAQVDPRSAGKRASKLPAGNEPPSAAYPSSVAAEQARWAAIDPKVKERAAKEGEVRELIGRVRYSLFRFR